MAPVDAARRSVRMPNAAPIIYVGAQKVRVPAILDRGSVLVPVRGVFEAIGADVAYSWPHFVIVRKDGAVIAAFTLGRTRAIAGHQAVDLAAPPMRRSGRMYVPLRVVAEAAGAMVAYTSRPAVVHIWRRAGTITATQQMATLPAAATLAPDIGPSSSTAKWRIGVAVFTGLCLLGCLVLAARRFATALFRPLAAKRAGRPVQNGTAVLGSAPVDAVALTSIESSGEARLRKQLVTETRTIEVPVTREELVIEYAGEGGTVIVQGRPLAAGETVRIPLWEERVHVDVTKHVILKEDIVIDKRRITTSRPVSERAPDCDLAEGSPS